MRLRDSQESQIEQVALIQSLLDQMLTFESLKQNKGVRDLLRVNETLEAPRERSKN